MRMVWLCTFWDEYKGRHVRRWREYGRKEIGQWIPNMLSAFRNEARYEIHVISVDMWMKQLYCSWRDENIVYHCFQPLVPFLGACPKIPLDSMTSFVWNRHRIRKLIEKIRPDIVHLFGIENPQYGSVVLDLPSEFPVICTIQGFVTRELEFANTYRNRVRAKFENLQIKRNKYFLGDYDSELYVREKHPEIVYDHMYFPVNDELIAATKPQALKYDVLFAGGQTKAKGFGDFLEVCAYCAERKSEFKAAVVGLIDAYPGTRDFVAKYHLEDVIAFTGRFPTQAGLFEVYRQSKMFLAPTYNDAFASTIRENMLLGTPCIAYKTGGIPYANNDGNENVVIVPQGDWRAMAEKVMFYSRNEAERLELAARAKAYAEKTFSLDANVGVIKRMYEKVLNHGM